MGQVNRDALYRLEIEARGSAGAGEALVRLGMAYSTGSAVPIDLILAHKWFDLAASKGVVDAQALRNQISHEMSLSQIAEAQRQARAWLEIS